MSTTALLFLAAVLLAAAPDPPADVLVRIAGPLTVAEGESVRTAIVINSDAVIDGAITGQLIVINGTARVRGELASGATVFNGTLALEPDSRAAGSIVLYRSELERSPQALVSGRIVHEIVPSMNELAWLLWVATTIVLVLAALVYTWLARRQLADSAELIRRQPTSVALATLGVVAGVPALAFIFMLTGVGVPVAITLMLFVLPALAFLGYLITGTSVGQLVSRAEPRLARNPYIAAALGVLMLQLLVAVPPLGGVFAVLATQIGAGALAYHIWRAHRAEPAPS